MRNFNIFAVLLLSFFVASYFFLSVRFFLFFLLLSSSFAYFILSFYLCLMFQNASEIRMKMRVISVIKNSIKNGIWLDTEYAMRTVHWTGELKYQCV